MEEISQCRDCGRYFDVVDFDDEEFLSYTICPICGQDAVRWMKWHHMYNVPMGSEN